MNAACGKVAIRQLLQGQKSAGSQYPSLFLNPLNSSKRGRDVNLWRHGEACYWSGKWSPIHTNLTAWGKAMISKTT